MHDILPLQLQSSMTRPIWTGHVASYRLVKWGWSGEAETLYLKDSRGRVVTALHDYRVTPFSSDEHISTHRLTKGGPRVIILRGWTGGAHGGFTFFVWSLGKKPRCLLAYDKVNGEYGHDFEFTDRDGDGVPEIRSWYDGFSYLVGAVNGTNLPVVFRYENGRYIDRTSRFPSLLRSAEGETWRDLGVADANIRATAIDLVALGDLLGHRPQTWSRLRRRLPKVTYAWLKAREPAILAIVRGRNHRVQHPRAFNPRPIKFDHFPPPRRTDLFDR